MRAAWREYVVGTYFCFLCFLCFMRLFSAFFRSFSTSKSFSCSRSSTASSMSAAIARVQPLTIVHNKLTDTSRFGVSKLTSMFSFLVGQSSSLVEFLFLVSSSRKRGLEQWKTGSPDLTRGNHLVQGGSSVLHDAEARIL